MPRATFLLAMFLSAVLNALSPLGPLRLGAVHATAEGEAYAEGKKASDGVISARCETSWNGYGYLTANIRVLKPFSLAGRALKVTAQTGAFRAEDSFYVKAFDARGRVVAAFYTHKRLDRQPATVILTPGYNADHGFTYFADNVTAPGNTTVARLAFFFGRRGTPDNPPPDCEFRVWGVELVERPELPTREGFRDLGVGIDDAELRNAIAVIDRKGHHLVIAAPLDQGPNYLLVTDLDTGATTQHSLPAPNTGAIFGAALTDDGRFIYALGTGPTATFDIHTRRFIRGTGKVGAALTTTIAPDGTVYLGCYPNTTLVAVDPRTGASRDYGRMDPQEHYINSMAVDDEGWIYSGIGTARANIIAFHPKTGRRVQLLPEKLRALGSASVLPGTDGCAYVSFGDFQARCRGGKILARNQKSPGTRRLNTLKYGTLLLNFPDGWKVDRYDLLHRRVSFTRADKSTGAYPIEYHGGGLDLTSLANGPDGKVYYSSSHPHHLGCADPATGALADLGHSPAIGGGNFCNMVAAHGKLYACEYSGGRLWEFDPAKPALFGNATPGHFGFPFNEIIRRSTVANAHWTDLSGRGLLLGFGETAENRFEVALPARADGAWHLNLQFYHYDAYGTVTVEAGQEKRTVDLQRAQEGPGAFISLGPFRLKKGQTLPVVFHVDANANGSSRTMFSLRGLGLARRPRTAPPRAEDAPPENPALRGSWAGLVTRPRAIAVSPVTGEVVFAGFPGYGRTGGGFGIFHPDTGEKRELKDWLPGESCIAMTFQPDGALVGGTSIGAPGGGHQTATQASVFRLDWPPLKVVNRLQLPGVSSVIAVALWQGKVYAATDNGHLLRIAADTWTVEDDADLSASGLPVRNAFVHTAEGRLFLIQSKGISEILPDHAVKPRAIPPWTICAGAGCQNGQLFFACQNGNHIGTWTYQK